MSQAFIILILVLFNAFFSLAEVALISARKNRLEAEAKGGNRNAKLALRLQQDPDLFLSTSQIGITIVSILTGIYSSAELSNSLTTTFIKFDIPESSANLIAQTTILIVATYLQCELGELFPKRIGIDMADRMARLCARPMMFFARIMTPFVWFLTWSTEILIHVFQLKKEDHRVTEEEIKSLIQEGTDSGEVDKTEQDIMERTLALGNQRISSLMTYRTDIITLDAGMGALAVEDIIHNTPFSTYPVIDGDFENMLGIISLKDLVTRLNKPNFSLKANLQKPIFLPENITVYKALEHLKRCHNHVAFICDEFGSIEGILTLRDILEALVGSIEEDEETPEIIERKDGNSWVVSGQCTFLDFLDYFDEVIDYDANFNTVAGLALTILDRIPRVGDEFEWSTFRFKILQMEGNRIDKILTTRVNQIDKQD